LAGRTGTDENETTAALARAVELGCNFFDTAWAYHNGRSERELGRLVRTHPESTLHAAAKIPPKNFKWPSQCDYTLDEGTRTGHLTKTSHWPRGDWRNSYFVPENLSQSVDRAEALRLLVPAGMTMAEFALRWILIAITGTRGPRFGDPRLARDVASGVHTARRVDGFQNKSDWRGVGDGG
jgi:aryl-alcohol dehydrogenase-like predicted oxidoreductase